MPVIQSPETVFLLQLYSKYARSELHSAARHYGIPEPSWPVSLQHGTDYFLPYIVALIAIRLGDSLDVHAAHQYYQVLYLIIVTSRQILNMPMVNKQLSMWSESMSTLLMVHHYGPRTHSRSSGDSGVYASTRTCTPSPTSCSPTQCTGSSESNSARTFHAPSTRSRTYTLEAPASLIPVENTIVGPSYCIFSTDSLLMQSRPSDGGIILATMTSLLHGLSSQTPTIPSPGHRNTP